MRRRLSPRESDSQDCMVRPSGQPHVTYEAVEMRLEETVHIFSMICEG